MRQSSDLHRWMVRCKQFRLRQLGTKPVVFISEEDLLPVDENGLYPGQKQLPPDYSDFDALDDTPVDLDGKDCKT